METRKSLSLKVTDVLRKTAILLMLMMVLPILLQYLPYRIVPVQAQTTETLVVNVFDESGYPPPSDAGIHRRLSDVTVKIYALNGTPVTSAMTNTTGTANFMLPRASYRITCGGGTELWYGEKDIVDLTSGPQSVDIHCFSVTFHNFTRGTPFELAYVDLNVTEDGYQNTISVYPGQQIHAQFVLWIRPTNVNQYWHASVFGDWSPQDALGEVGKGMATPLSDDRIPLDLTFRAPDEFGIHTIRLVGTLDIDWPNSFYTGFHENQNLARDMAISVISKLDEYQRAHYGIGTVKVVDISPRFEVSHPLSSIVMGLNENVFTQILVTSVRGFDSLVELSVDYPPNMYVSLGETSLYIHANSNASTVLSIITFWNTTIREEIPINVTATDGTISDQVDVMLTVNGPVPFEMELGLTYYWTDVGEPVSVELKIRDKRPDFNYAIELSSLNLPSGFTCCFSSPTLLNVTDSIITIHVSYGAVSGSNDLTFMGSSQGFSRNVTITILVEIPRSPFEVVLPPTSSIIRGESVLIPINARLQNVDSTFPITLGVANLPDGLTCTFDKNVIFANETSIVTVEALDDAEVGQYQLTLMLNSQAFSHNLSDSVSFWLFVKAPPLPVWMQSWFWILFIGVGGIVIASWVGQHYYAKWRKAKTPLDLDYLKTAGSLSKLEELRLLGKISQEEYEKSKKEQERKLKGD